jgi:transposase
VYNKDHRPDLKQLLFILTVARDGCIPVHFQVASGNVVDDRTHRATWDLLCRLTGRRDFLYVADCKLATAENMAHIHRKRPPNPFVQGAAGWGPSFPGAGRPPCHGG